MNPRRTCEGKDEQYTTEILVRWYMSATSSTVNRHASPRSLHCLILLDLQQVQKRICGMGIVSAERLKTELSVHENDGVARFEEVGCTSSSFYYSNAENEQYEDSFTQSSLTHTKIVQESYTRTTL